MLLGLRVNGEDTNCTKMGNDIWMSNSGIQPSFNQIKGKSVKTTWLKSILKDYLFHSVPRNEKRNDGDSGS